MKNVIIQKFPFYLFFFLLLAAKTIAMSTMVQKRKLHLM